MKQSVGDIIPRRSIESIASGPVSIPDTERVLHLQFRRYAGCPICHWHLATFFKRHAELEQRGIVEVVVFHSTQAEMQTYGAEAPFAMIADPERALYREFGVETSLWSFMDPRAWSSGFQGLLAHGVTPPKDHSATLQLPADFIIQPDGVISALKYGAHANDQWSFNEVLEFGSTPSNAARK